MQHQSATEVLSVQPSINNDLIRALTSELISLQNLINNLPYEAELLVKKLLTITGKVIFSGSGKSGLVARKLAATFSSMGTAALFMHPNDALHGDLGVIQKNDLFIALSKSGNSDEFEKIFSFLSTQNYDSVLLCCYPGLLMQTANLVIQLPIITEACHLNLAPTSSTTLMMAFGDAVAIATAQQRGFTSHDFARVHPAGTLGKKLLLTVADIMHKGDRIPLISPNCLFQDLLITITQKKLGVGIIVDEEQNLLGIVTDGDLRRACNNGIKVFEQKAHEFMTRDPRSIPPTMLALEALEYMEQYNITTLTVINDTKVIGLIHIHDLIKAGLQG